MLITNLQGILDLAKELLEINPGNLRFPESYLTHLSLTYEIAEETVDKIISKYPGLEKKLKKEEVVLAAGLHDIGRPLQENQLFHELRGARFIEEQGLEKGVADSLTDVYRIAQILRSHGTMYERFIDPENADARKEFEPIDISLLVPRTWQEAVVTFSDNSNGGGKRLIPEEALAEVIKRYQIDPAYKSDMIARSLKAGQKRILIVCRRVEALSEGRLSEEEIIKYGFL